MVVTEIFEEVPFAKLNCYLTFKVFIELDVDPGEPRTWDHPGCPGGIEITEHDILEVEATDDNGELIPVPLGYHDEVEKYIFNIDEGDLWEMIQ